MNKKFDKLGFYPADILLPKGQDMNKWAAGRRHGKMERRRLRPVHL